MKRTTWIYLLMATLMAGLAEVGADEAQEKKEPAAAPTEEVILGETEAEEVVLVDDEWAEVWTQIDEAVAREEFELQVTVTVSGVRGTEAEDEILDRLYYKGSSPVVADED